MLYGANKDTNRFNPFKEYNPKYFNINLYF